jgi:hypothetical protein
MPRAAPIIPYEVHMVKHRGAPTVCFKIPRRKNVKLKMQTYRLSSDERVKNLNVDKELCWN